MKILRAVFEFYINASIHVALAVYSLFKVSEIYLEITNSIALGYIVFFGAISGYNFVKYARVATLYHRSLTRYLRTIQVFSFGCFLMMCFYISKLPSVTLFYFFPVAIITFFYAVPFTFKNKLNLRNIPGLKVYVIALVWSIVTVLIPFFASNENIDIRIVFMSIQRFIIVLVLLLPFEIRDFNYDHKILKTIPHIIGIDKTKKLGITLLICSLVLEYLIASSPQIKNAFMLLFFVLLIFIMRSNIKQSKYYSSFWVESLPIIWWFFLLIWQ